MESLEGEEDQVPQDYIITTENGNYAMGEGLFAEKFHRLKFRDYQGDTR
jgi:hypothetical protein